MKIELGEQHCTFCNHNLEEGIFVSRGGNFFVPIGGKIPPRYSRASFKKENAIMLTHPYGFNYSVRPTVYICRNCKVVYFPYQEE